MMRTFNYSVLESTQIEASSLIAAKTTLPFAVVAEKQSKGKGRRGASWQSPKGNLYISLVIPPLKDLGLSPSEITMIPLKAGLLVAEWLLIRFHFRATLKWPNDIYFMGKKLGGILCETSHKGQEFGPIVIGIGLNVSESPIKESTALTDIIATKPREGVKKLSQEFLAFWENVWESLLKMPHEDFLNRFEGFAIEKGQPWQQHDDIVEYISIDKLGSFLAKSVIRAGDLISLSNVDHEYQWLYQNPKSPLIIADVGNSNTKIAFFKSLQSIDPDESLSAASNSSDVKNFLSQLRKKYLAVLSNKFDDGFRIPFHVASVSFLGSEDLAILAHELNYSLIPIPKRPLRRWDLYEKTIGTRGYDFEKLGIDRLATIEGYLFYVRDTKHPVKKRGQKKPFALIINCGTATTLDFVNTSGEHFGGLIIPGIQTSLSSLSVSTDRLPEINFRETDGLSRAKNLSLGHSTEDAMLTGSILVAIGTIHEVLMLISKKYHISSQRIDLVFTGGFGAILAKACEGVYLPYLTLQGIKRMVLGG